MASATAASDTTDGAVLTRINKRIRNLKKKLNRIAQLEESVAQGKSAIKNKDQEELLKSKPSIVAVVDELVQFRQKLTVAVDEEISITIKQSQVGTSVVASEAAANYALQAPAPVESTFTLLQLMKESYESFMARHIDSLAPIACNVLPGRRIRACYHGWIVLSNIPDNALWTLWNPTTSKLIRLPVLDCQRTVSHECCLSAPPGDQGSIFLLFTEKVGLVLLCRLDCNRWQRKWIELSYNQQMIDIDAFGYLERPTCYNGKVYALSLHPLNRSVIEVELVVRGNKVSMTLVPFVRLPFAFSSYNNRYYGDYLTVFSFSKGSPNNLFFFEVCFDNRTSNSISEVNVFKLNKSRMMWELTEDIKDSGFFMDITRGHTEYEVFYKPSISLSPKIGGCVHILPGRGSALFRKRLDEGRLYCSEVSDGEKQVMVWAMLESRLEADESHQEEDENEIEITPLIEGVSYRIN